MNTVFACQTDLFPSLHTAGSSHPSEETEIGDVLFQRHLTQQAVHIRHHRITLPFAVHLTHHIARSDKEDRRFRCTFADVLHLLSQSFDDAGDSAGVLIEGDRIAAELHDDQSDVLLAVERLQLRLVHFGEHQSEAPAHRDIIYDHAGLTLLGEPIDGASAGERDGVACEGIMDGGVGEDTPAGVCRRREERRADRRQFFRTLDEAVVHHCYLPHDAVETVISLVAFKPIDQIAPRSLSRLDKTAVHAQLLFDRFVRYRLRQRHQSASLTAVSGLQRFADLLAHAVFLYLAVAVVKHAHDLTAALRQRSIESGKEHAAVGDRVHRHFGDNRPILSPSLKGRKGICCNYGVRSGYTPLLFREGLGVGLFRIKHFRKGRPAQVMGAERDTPGQHNTQRCQTSHHRGDEEKNSIGTHSLFLPKSPAEQQENREDLETADEHDECRRPFGYRRVVRICAGRSELTD